MERSSACQGELYSYSVITVGNINSTYKVTYAVGDNKYKAYLFQRINTHVFKNPVQIMKNIDEVTSYIREKYPGQLTLHFPPYGRMETTILSVTKILSGE